MGTRTAQTGNVVDGVTITVTAKRNVFGRSTFSVLLEGDLLTLAGMNQRRGEVQKPTPEQTKASLGQIMLKNYPNREKVLAVTDTMLGQVEKEVGTN